MWEAGLLFCCDCVGRDNALLETSKNDCVWICGDSESTLLTCQSLQCHCCSGKPLTVASAASDVSVLLFGFGSFI